MCCRKNRAVYGAPGISTTNTQGGQYGPSSYGAFDFQTRRGHCGERRRRGGLVGMLVRAVQERHETKQSQVNASSSATTNNQNVTSNAAEAYNPGYQRAFMEHKDVAKVEDETHRKGRRASLDDDLGGWRLEDAPPPMYEMVERNEK